MDSDNYVVNIETALRVLRSETFKKELSLTLSNSDDPLVDDREYPEVRADQVTKITNPSYASEQ